MTGDSSGRKQALSVFLSTLMVLSVLAMGMVGFAGSAVALQDPNNVGEYGGVVVSGGTADDASGGNTANLQITVIQSQGTDVSANLDEVSISFEQEVGENALSDNDLAITVINPNGITAGSTTQSVGSVDDGNNQISLTGIDSDSDIALGEHKIIRIEIQGDEVSLPSDDLNLTVKIVDADGDSATTDLKLQLNPGPVQVEDGNSYTSISRALADGAIDDEANTITVSDGLYDEATSRLGDVSNDDVTIEAADGANPKVIFSGNPIASTAFTASGDSVTVSGLDFELFSTANIEDHLFDMTGADATLENNSFNLSAAGGNGVGFSFVRLGGNNAQIQNNAFVDNFDNTNLDGIYAVQGSTGDTADSVLIKNNTFETAAGVYMAGNNFLVTNNTFNVSFTYGVTTSDSGANPVDNAVISGNEFYVLEDPATSDKEAIRLFDGDNMTIENNIIDGLSDEFNYGIVMDSQGDASSGFGSGGTADELGDVTVTGNEIFNVTGSGLYVVDSGNWLSGSPGVTLDINNLTVDNVDASSSPTANGIEIDAGSNNLIAVEIADSSINSTDFGINAKAMTGTNNDVLNISNTSVTNSGTTAIKLSGADADVNINGGSIDQATTGVKIDISTAAHTVDVDGVTINDTTTGVEVANIEQDGDVVNLINNVFTQNTDGLKFSDTTGISGHEEVSVHFNTFEDNTDGVTVTGDPGASIPYDVTFNDFVENNKNGLHIEGDYTDEIVNAKYNWWGSDAGPNSAAGDTVTTANAGDATTEPFLLQSAVDNYDDSNLGGTNVLRFGHNVEVTNNKGAVSFPTTANRTAGASIEGDTSNVMVYKLVDGQFVDAGDQVPQTMEGHVVDLTEATNTSAFVTITYSDDVADSSGGYTYEQGANLVGAPIKGPAGNDAVFNLEDDYVISPYLSNTENSLAGSYSGTSSNADSSTITDNASPFSAYVIEVPSNETRFKGGNIPGGTDASEIVDLLLGL